MDLPHKNAWAPFSNYTLQLHMDFHGFKWLISFCACSFQISIIMFIFLYRLTGGDDHADQRGKACLKCFCDTFDSDRCMNSLTRRWMSICSRSMVQHMKFVWGKCRRGSEFSFQIRKKAIIIFFLSVFRYGTGLNQYKQLMSEISNARLFFYPIIDLGKTMVI